VFATRAALKHRAATLVADILDPVGSVEARDEVAGAGLFEDRDRCCPHDAALAARDNEQVLRPWSESAAQQRPIDPVGEREPRRSATTRHRRTRAVMSLTRNNSAASTKFVTSDDPP